MDARCGSRRRRAACAWSRSTRRSRRRFGGCSGCRSTSTPSTAGRGGPTRSLGAWPPSSRASGRRSRPSPFESLVTSISAQQVSLFAAFAIRNRLIERFGERGEHAFSFPTRERLADADEDELFALGFSHRKAEYVVGLARSDLDLDALAALPDDEVKAQITALRGLGEWTADWFLARHLARPRAWAPGDLGVRKAIAAFYGDEDPRTVVGRFDPFQNLTVHHLLTGARVLG